MSSSSHIVSSFDKDLNQLETMLLEMGGLVEQQLVNATKALKLEDGDTAKTVIAAEARVNEIEADLNELALRVLALRQPVAGDLRNVVMTLRIAGHLERSGDYIKNMARRINTMQKADAFFGSINTLVRMCEMVQAMIKDVLDAFSRRDFDAADAVRNADQNVDLMLNSLFRELLTYMMEDVRNISGGMHLLFIAKNIERVGDHAVDIAQEVMFIISGEWPQQKRDKADKTSRMIVDPDDVLN